MLLFELNFIVDAVGLNEDSFRRILGISRPSFLHICIIRSQWIRNQANNLCWLTATQTFRNKLQWDFYEGLKFFIVSKYGHQNRIHFVET